MAKARLSSTFEALSGRLGTTVLSNEQDGTSVRTYNPMSKQPFTAVQVQREGAFRKANQAWTLLPLATATLWRNWGRTQKVRNELTGKYRSRSGKDCFVGLYAKLLQMNAFATAPAVPVGTFAGDVGVLSVVAGSGIATWTTTAANSAGVTTELLYQQLPSAVALPQPGAYHSAKFQAFAVGTLTTTTALAPGHYSFAYQFVEAATGRTAGFTALPTGRVTLALVQGGADEAEEMAKAA